MWSAGRINRCKDEDYYEEINHSMFPHYDRLADSLIVIWNLLLQTTDSYSISQLVEPLPAVSRYINTDSVCSKQTVCMIKEPLQIETSTTDHECIWYNRVSRLLLLEGENRESPGRDSVCPTCSGWWVDRQMEVESYHFPLSHPNKNPLKIHQRKSGYDKSDDTSADVTALHKHTRYAITYILLLKVKICGDRE